MSSSKLEVSYSAKGKLQVKMWGAGKKLYNLVTTEKGAGREQINKSLPKEIKAALGQSKYERLQQVTYEKRKEIKEKQYGASQMEKYKKEMDEKREEIRKVQQNIESLENSDGAQRDIDKLKAKLRMLEAEHVKARKKYLDSYGAERRKSFSEENIEVMEDIQEDLINEEVENTSEAIKAIKKRKDALDWRKGIELKKSLDPDATAE